jgi:hypothetical protein
MKALARGGERPWASNCAMNAPVSILQAAILAEARSVPGSAIHLQRHSERLPAGMGAATADGPQVALRGHQVKILTTRSVEIASGDRFSSASVDREAKHANGVQLAFSVIPLSQESPRLPATAWPHRACRPAAHARACSGHTL